MLPTYYRPLLKQRIFLVRLHQLHDFLIDHRIPVNALYAGAEGFPSVDTSELRPATEVTAACVAVAVGASVLNAVLRPAGPQSGIGE